MQLQFEGALDKRGYDRLINIVPEDSAVHAICRLHILSRQLNELREDLADRVQYRIEIEYGCNSEDSDIEEQDGEPQEISGESFDIAS
jgi:hypothetical protein